MKIDATIVEEARKFVIDKLDKDLPDNYFYHNKKHTLDVLQNSEIIAYHSVLNQEDKRILQCGALFHDLGYIDGFDEHEAKSAAYADEFLKLKNVDANIIDEVKQAILSTKMPQKPRNKISRILCDADLMYLSDELHYFDEAELLRKEWIETGKSYMSEKEFYKNSLKFFENHHYHTKYGKQVLSPGKEKIYRDIQKKYAEM